MKKLCAILIIISIFVCHSGLFANNIQISNVSLDGQVYTDQYVFVEFDISWENSWRTSAIPLNHDAAWLFVKYRPANQEWHHMLLRQTDFIAPSGSILQVSPDSVGALIYRDTDGNGTVNWQNVRFRWDYGEAGIANDALVEVRVYGIEMVYVPEGAFYVGDDSASACFHQGNTTYNPYYITSEGSITIGNSTASEIWAKDNIVSGNLPSAYPKGFDDFYCMKYELSQEQYVEFLNTLDRTQQNTRITTDILGETITDLFVMTGTTTIYFRNGIYSDASIGLGDPVNFYCNYTDDGNPNQLDDGQNIPCSYLSWQDIAAYLDWSGLRPMTELEFEKICRGPNPTIKGEYVWGTTTVHTSSYSLVNDGTANELINNIGTAVGNAMYFETNQGLGGNLEGPLRCGIFAASSPNHTRVETGASYFGVMELGGNLLELLVSIFDVAGRSFTGIHGNGEVNYNGNADVDHWPGINGNTSESTPNGVYGGVTGVTYAAGTGVRGGSDSNFADLMIISDRYYVATVGTHARSGNYGFHGCRTSW